MEEEEEKTKREMGQEEREETRLETASSN
jgi:hypothetical protein